MDPINLLIAPLPSSPWSKNTSEGHLVFFNSVFLWQAFFTANILICQSSKSTRATNNINAGSVLFKWPSKPWCAKVSHHVRYQKSETEAKWIINFIIYTCTFPTVSYHNVICEKGPLSRDSWSVNHDPFRELQIPPLTIPYLIIPFNLDIH